MDSDNVENANKIRRRRKSDVCHGVQADKAFVNLEKGKYQTMLSVIAANMDFHVVPRCNRVKRCKSVVQNAKRDLGSEFNKVAEFETMKIVEDNLEGSGVDQRLEFIVESGEGSSNPRKRFRSLRSETDGVSRQLQNVEKLGGGAW
ncbi:hypothetical protein RIF29_01995 [Crotalaria pallida]|uniref:Uncharacterized protein n=1 Tax=Crotalaria pallida TaxID=3830 RepID=A0AAN9J046_CROPI